MLGFFIHPQRWLALGFLNHQELGFQLRLPTPEEEPLQTTSQLVDETRDIVPRITAEVPVAVEGDHTQNVGKILDPNGSSPFLMAKLEKTFWDYTFLVGEISCMENKRHVQTPFISASRTAK